MNEIDYTKSPGDQANQAISGEAFSRGVYLKEVSGIPGKIRVKFDRISLECYTRSNWDYHPQLVTFITDNPRGYWAPYWQWQNNIEVWCEEPPSLYYSNGSLYEGPPMGKPGGGPNVAKRYVYMPASPSFTYLTDIPPRDRSQNYIKTFGFEDNNNHKVFYYDPGTINAQVLKSQTGIDIAKRKISNSWENPCVPGGIKKVEIDNTPWMPDHGGWLESGISGTSGWRVQGDGYTVPKSGLLDLYVTPIEDHKVKFQVIRTITDEPDLIYELTAMKNEEKRITIPITTKKIIWVPQSETDGSILSWIWGDEYGCHSGTIRWKQWVRRWKVIEPIITIKIIKRWRYAYEP